MNIPDNILDYCGSKNPEQLQTMLDEFKLMHNNLKDIDVSLPISIIEQLLITKSQGNYYLFYGEDMGHHGDDYLPDGYLLYQHIHGRRLTPILPPHDPGMFRNDPSRVVEDFSKIIDYLVEKKINTVYTGNNNYGSLSLTNSNYQSGLYVTKLRNLDSYREKLKKAGIELRESDRII